MHAIGHAYARSESARADPLYVGRKIHDGVRLSHAPQGSDRVQGPAARVRPAAGRRHPVHHRQGRRRKNCSTRSMRCSPKASGWSSPPTARRRRSTASSSACCRACRWAWSPISSPPIIELRRSILNQRLPTSPETQVRRRCHRVPRAHDQPQRARTGRRAQQADRLCPADRKPISLHTGRRAADRHPQRPTAAVSPSTRSSARSASSTASTAAKCRRSAAPARWFARARWRCTSPRC
jgi:hypothetical protein